MYILEQQKMATEKMSVLRFWSNQFIVLMLCTPHSQVFLLRGKNILNGVCWILVTSSFLSVTDLSRGDTFWQNPKFRFGAREI